jgi:hypothetical protein
MLYQRPSRQMRCQRAADFTAIAARDPGSGVHRRGGQANLRQKLKRG